MRIGLILLSILALAGCGDTQHAAYLVAGPQHSLTLTRQQAFVGSEWDTELVVARFPECQRRYPMKEMVTDAVKIDVYRTEPGVFILNSGKRWYVTETRSCRLEQFKDTPPAPGDLIGRFQFRDGTIEYKSLETPVAAVPPAPTSAGKP
jgi:hypothetical protein